jgi:hypothetical protein
MFYKFYAVLLSQKINKVVFHLLKICLGKQVKFVFHLKIFIPEIVGMVICFPHIIVY